MDNQKNFGENEMNEMLKKFNQKNKKEDDEDKNFIIPNTNKKNNINIISSYNQQIESLTNQIKLLEKMLQERDDIIKKLEKENKNLEKEIKIFIEQKIKKYGGNKNQLDNMNPTIRKKTEIYNKYEIINIEQNITPLRFQFSTINTPWIGFYKDLIIFF